MNGAPTGSKEAILPRQGVAPQASEGEDGDVAMDRQARQWRVGALVLDRPTISEKRIAEAFLSSFDKTNGIEAAITNGDRKANALRMRLCVVAELPAVSVARTFALVIAPAALAFGAAAPAICAKPNPTACQASGLIWEHIPTPQPWRWLGECPNGRAEGLGVLRMGTAESGYTFFYGRMRGGRPVAGYLQQDLWVRLAYGFTPAGLPIEPDVRNNMDQRHAVFVLGSRAAMATSRWFAARGNRASARWYRERARHILDVEPR